jgi:hypothetical protein
MQNDDNSAIMKGYRYKKQQGGLHFDLRRLGMLKEGVKKGEEVSFRKNYYFFGDYFGDYFGEILGKKKEKKKKLKKIKIWIICHFHR